MCRHDRAIFLFRRHLLMCIKYFATERKYRHLIKQRTSFWSGMSQKIVSAELMYRFMLDTSTPRMARKTKAAHRTVSICILYNFSDIPTVNTAWNRLPHIIVGIITALFYTEQKQLTFWTFLDTTATKKFICKLKQGPWTEFFKWTHPSMKPCQQISLLAHRNHRGTVSSIKMPWKK
jgi:hypothetical protein